MQEEEHCKESLNRYKEVQCFDVVLVGPENSYSSLLRSFSAFLGLVLNLLVLFISEYLALLAFNFLFIFLDNLLFHFLCLSCWVLVHLLSIDELLLKSSLVL